MGGLRSNLEVLQSDRSLDLGVRGNARVEDRMWRSNSDRLAHGVSVLTQATEVPCGLDG